MFIIEILQYIKPFIPDVKNTHCPQKTPQKKKEFKHLRGWRHQEINALWIKWSRFICSHRDLSSTHMTSSLSQALCMCMVAFFLVLIRHSWMWEQVGLWPFFLLLSSFPSVSALPSFDLDFCFILLYFTLSYLVASSRSLFFSNETGREWIKTVGKVGRNWEEESEGNSNHGML